MHFACLDGLDSIKCKKGSPNLDVQESAKVQMQTLTSLLSQKARQFYYKDDKQNELHETFTEMWNVENMFDWNR